MDNIYNISFLDKAISTCFTLRKLKSIIIYEKNMKFNLRPQLHLMIVSPFGTSKSSITKSLSNKFKNDVYEQDEFTKASLYGTISENGKYTPSILENVGGKVLVIDEWNNIDSYSQHALLSVLENQKMSRSLGYSSSKVYKYTGSLKKYVKYEINKNIIKGEFYFSCIACAMDYPIYSDVQKAKALLSRFSPLFIEPTRELIEAVTSGEFYIGVDDFSRKVEHVEIPYEIHVKFHELFHKYVNENKLYPSDTDDYGYIARVMSEIIRYGVFSYLKENETKFNIIKLDDVKYFTQNFDYIDALLHQFENPRTKGKIYQFKKLYQKYGENKSCLWYSKVLACSRHTIYDYKNKLGVDIDGNETQ